MASGIKLNSALYFCGGAELIQTFCMHVFAEGYTQVPYDMKLSDSVYIVLLQTCDRIVTCHAVLYILE